MFPYPTVFMNRILAQYNFARKNLMETSFSKEYFVHLRSYFKISNIVIVVFLSFNTSYPLPST